jgi:hypothetical protein
MPQQMNLETKVGHKRNLKQTSLKVLACYFHHPHFADNKISGTNMQYPENKYHCIYNELPIVSSVIAGNRYTPTNMGRGH